MQHRLSVRALAASCAIFWSVGLFLFTWWAILFGGVTNDPTIIGRLYLGYTISPQGSVIGLVWGLADGAVGGAIFAWLYNSIVARIETLEPPTNAGKARQS